jgi:hypothetical protein
MVCTLFSSGTFKILGKKNKNIGKTKICTTEKVHQIEGKAAQTLS